MILAIFDLQVPLSLPCKLLSSQFLIKTILAMLIYKSPRFFSPGLDSVDLSVQNKKFKIDFQDGGHGGHLGLLIRMILAIFDIQVTLILLTKFQVNWPFRSGEEVQNIFSKWLPRRLSWIFDQTNFSFF